MNRPDICQSEDGEERPCWPSSQEVENIQPLPASSLVPLPPRSRPGLLRYLRRFHSTWYGQPRTGTTAFVDTSVTFASGVFNTSWVDELMWEGSVPLRFSENILRACVRQRSYGTAFISKRAGLGFRRLPLSIRVRSRFTQDLRPGAFSAVPAGLVSVGIVHPGLRPGLLSAVPSGLVPIHPDSCFVFSECCPNQPKQATNLDKTDSQPSPSTSSGQALRD
jgi:hypothetical protein